MLWTTEYSLYEVYSPQNNTKLEEKIFHNPLFFFEIVNERTDYIDD